MHCCFQARVYYLSCFCNCFQYILFPENKQSKLLSRFLSDSCYTVSMNTHSRPATNHISDSSEYSKHAEEFMTHMGIVIMASGEGKRFGSNKLLAPLSGKPLLQYILDATGCFPLRVVVTKHPAIADLCQTQDIPFVLHDCPDRNDTIRLGVSYLEENHNRMDNGSLAGILFCQGDQPLLSETTLQRFFREACKHKDAVILQSRDASEAYEGDAPCMHSETSEADACHMHSKVRLGSPVYFSSHFFGALKTLPKGKGGRILIQSNPDKLFPVPVPSQELLDVDTPTDFIEISRYL